MYKIGEIARKSASTLKALRYFDRIGLLTPEWRNPVSGYRMYGEDSLRSLRLIRSARQAGLTLNEIREIIRTAGLRDRLRRASSVLDRRVAMLEAGLDAVRRFRRECEAWAREDVR